MTEKPFYYSSDYEFLPLEGAKLIKFDVTGDHEFYAHKKVKTGKGWAVTDSRSGIVIQSADKRADAIRLSKERLEKYGVDKFHEVSKSAFQRALDRPKKIALLDEFGKVTGLSKGVYRNLYLEQLTGPSFDPISLDVVLKRLSGYNHEQSCKDNLEAMYGKRARYIAEELLKVK